MNPITGLMVQPTSVRAAPMLGITTAIPKLIRVRIKVQKMFCLEDMPFYLYNSSSIVSFEGSTQSGAAQITANRSEKFPIYIIIEF